MNILFCKSTKRLTWMPCFQKPLGVGCGPHRRCRSDGGQAPSTTPPLPAPGPGPHHITANKPRATRKKSPSRSRPPPAPPFPFLPLPLPLSLGARRDRAEEPYRPPSPKAAAEAGAQLRGRLEVRGCVWNRRWAREIRPAGMQQDQRNKVWPLLLLSSCLLVNFAVSLPTFQKHIERERETVAARC